MQEAPPDRAQPDIGPLHLGSEDNAFLQQGTLGELLLTGDVVQEGRWTVQHAAAPAPLTIRLASR